MRKGLISGLVLLILGLVMGGILAFVNSITAPVITLHENEAKYAAIAEFYDLTQYDSDIEEVTVENSLVNAMYLLKQNGELKAIVYSVSQNGFQSEVKMLIAVDSDLIVHDYAVVEQAETAGYGSLSTTHDFNMVGVDITTFDASNWDSASWKAGTSTFDAISGATITSTAVNDCFKAVFERAASDFGGAA